MRLVLSILLTAIIGGSSHSCAQVPQPKSSDEKTKLYTDDEIRKLAKHDIDKETGGDKGIFGVPCLEVVPSGESYERSKVFKAVKIDDARIRDFRHEQASFVVFLTWQVSPSYDICCMSATNDRDNDGLGLTDPKRKVYGIRLLKRAK
jgi:hypothetical protein